MKNPVELLEENPKWLKRVITIVTSRAIQKIPKNLEKNKWFNPRELNEVCVKWIPTGIPAKIPNISLEWSHNEFQNESLLKSFQVEISERIL